MSSNGNDDGRSPAEPERDDPISELRELSIDPPAGFTDRLRRRIERRETSNHALWFSWYLPGAVLLAFLEMLFAVFGFSRSDGGG